MTTYINPPVETDPDVLSQEAIDYLVANVPGYEPSDGHLEMWQLYALARMVSEANDTASAVPLSIFRYFGANLAGILPVNAVSATIPTTWTMRDNAGYTIPAGTQVAYPAAGDTFIPFVTTAAVVIPPGSVATAAGAVVLTAVNPGTTANGLAAGAMTLLDPLAFVSSVVATAASAGGIDAEDDDTYLSRLIDELALLTPRPIFATDFAVLARSRVGVHRAVGVDNYDPARAITASTTNGSNAVTSTVAGTFLPSDVPDGMGNPGKGITGPGIPAGATVATYTDSQHITISANATATAANIAATLAERLNMPRMVAIAAVDVNGAPVSAAVKTDIQSYLAAMREINFVVSVFDPTVTVVDVAFQFKVYTGYDPSQVQAAALAAVTSYLEPYNWGVLPNDPAKVSWSNRTTVRYNDIIALLYSIPGLKSVTALTIHGASADYALPGQAPLPTPGTISGTVVP